MNNLVKEVLEKVAREGDVITMDELVEDIGINKYQLGLNLYKVEVHAYGNNGRYYKGIIRDLEFEIEDSLIMASDADNIIQDSGLCLRYFMENSVKILKTKSEDVDLDISSYKIISSDGVVTITPIEN